MRVYEIVQDFTPKTGRYREYASVNHSTRYNNIVDSVGRGNRLLPSWKPIKLYVDAPSSPWPDFMGLSYGYVCNQRAIDIAGTCLEQVGELLPVTFEGETDQFKLFNYCNSIVDALDPDASIYEVRKATGRSTLAMPAFRSSELGGLAIFKIRERFSNFFVVEKDAPSGTQQLRSLVETSGLTGIKFNLVWTEKDGPAIPECSWGQDDPFEYRRHDGTPWVFPKSKLPSKKPVTKLVKTARPSAKKQKRTSK